MFTNLRHLRPAAAPACAALLLTALTVLEDRHFDKASALLVALVAAIAVAELLPTAALAFVVAALLLQAFQVFPLVLVSGVLSYLAVPLAVFFSTLGWKPARRRWVLPASAVIFAAITTASWFVDQTWINFVFGNQLYGRGILRTATYGFLIFGAFSAFNLAAWAAGLAANAASRSRRAQLRAESRLRETATELALERERTRIARELHDVLAHSLAVIIAQADGIRYIHRQEPEAVEGSASVIAESARTALIETRRLVEGFATENVSQPSPGMADLPGLVERLSATGMPVRMEAEGAPWQMTAAQDLTIYRLAQESLTNAFKHADRSAGTNLEFSWTMDGVQLRIRSVLRAEDRLPASDSGGHGLAGMRARAAAAGGWLESTQDSTSFSVTAYLPSTASILPEGFLAPGVPSPKTLQGAQL
jgi:signal transduction histidine kinase